MRRNKFAWGFTCAVVLAGTNACDGYRIFKLTDDSEETREDEESEEETESAVAPANSGSDRE